MVKVEQRICSGVSNVRPTIRKETGGNKPLGVHFGPLLQFDPALNGHVPNKSLSMRVSNPDRQSGERHIPCHNLVNRSVGAITTLEKFLETDKVTWEAVHHILDTLASEECLERFGYGRGSIPEAATR